MSSFVISGGNRLDGEITLQGSKNAVLPVLAATILSNGKNVIYNCPKISDVSNTIDVLTNLGCNVTYTNHIVEVDSSSVNNYTIPEELMRRMRSSIIFLGAIIARCKKARVSMPGGCEIGLRPIDLHLKALRQLGIQITEEHGYINCEADKIVGNNIHLDFPSVGATENVMLAACMAQGTTILVNAAREPEIVDLEAFLNRMGARISGAGTGTIRIDGVDKLYGVEHTIIPDRIAAGTYMICAAITGGKMLIRDANRYHMSAILNILSNMGCDIRYAERNIFIMCNKRTSAFGSIKTMPYPGFPTDIQSPFMSLATLSCGTSMFIENIFENRFQHVDELIRMGADIRIDGRCAVVVGVEKLTGAHVVAKELRGAAALVAAGLSADGEVVIDNIEYIDRGYENIEKYLTQCGGQIIRKE